MSRQRLAPLLCTLLLLCAAAAQAQPASVSRPDAATPERRREREEELRRIEEEAQRLQREAARLAAELAELRGDRQRLAAALVTTAEGVRSAETGLLAAERRLASLAAEEAGARAALAARRGTLMEVLAALQRLGRKPPPAVLVRPEDMLAAIRTSMMFGAVLPELKAETAAIVAALDRLVQLREAIGREREGAAAEAERLGRERQRLAALVEARQAALDSGEARQAEERRRAQSLARDAQSLKELIARMDAEIAAMARVAQIARAAPPPSQNPAQAAAMAPGALREMARLQPKIPFQDTRGTLALPAAGQVTRAFGAADGLGGRENGVTLATARHAVVTTPVDGWISFAGPYRSYGQVLIINGGGGYHIVMTGLDRVSVEIGQFVLAGEPVASMGATAAGALAGDGVRQAGGQGGGQGGAQSADGGGAGAPLIYIEFRKDGAPIDPGPWWMKSEVEKVRG